MALEYFVQADRQLSFESTMNALEKCGLQSITLPREGAVKGNLPSGMIVYSQCTNEDVMHIGDWEFDWRVYRWLRFRVFNPNYSECVQEMIRFIEEITVSTNARFILTFNMEVVYAIRDEQGLKMVRNFFAD